MPGARGWSRAGARRRGRARPGAVRRRSDRVEVRLVSGLELVVLLEVEAAVVGRAPLEARKYERVRIVLVQGPNQGQLVARILPISDQESSGRPRRARGGTGGSGIPLRRYKYTLFADCT